MQPEDPAIVAASESLHAWEAGGADSAEALSAWVGARLKVHEAALTALLAVEGERHGGVRRAHYSASGRAAPALCNFLNTASAMSSASGCFELRGALNPRIIAPCLSVATEP